MDNQLIPYNGNQMTPLGNLYMERISDTLHRVKKFKINFINGESQEISYKQFVGLTNALDSPNPPRFIQFDGDEALIATNQIASVRSYETIVDTRREDM